MAWNSLGGTPKILALFYRIRASHANVTGELARGLEIIINKHLLRGYDSNFALLSPEAKATETQDSLPPSRTLRRMSRLQFRVNIRDCTSKFELSDSCSGR
jgi:hypothetical protein